MIFKGDEKSEKYSLIEALFGKPLEVITCRDLVKFMESNITESNYLELKGCGEYTFRRKFDENLLRQHIVRTVIAFLNSLRGEGILILGFHRKASSYKFSPMPYISKKKDVEIIENKIRDWVLNDVRSIPYVGVPPLLSIKVFDAKNECNLSEEGFIAIIYVKKLADAIYYDVKDGQAYIREGSRSRLLKIDEALELLEKKMQPFIFPILHPLIINDSQILQLNLVLYNMGPKPADLGSVVIKIPKQITVRRQIDMELSKNDQVFSLEFINSDLAKIREDNNVIVFHYIFAYPNQLPMFPGVPSDTKRNIIFKIQLSDSYDLLLISYGVTIHTNYNRVEAICKLIIELDTGRYQILCDNYEVFDYTLWRTILKVGINEGFRLLFNGSLGRPVVIKVMSEKV